MKKASLFRPKILFIVQLPPPVHGVSVMNYHAVNNPLWNEQYDKKTIRLNFGQRLEDLGTITPGKLAGMFKVFLEICYTLVSFRPALIYFTMMPTGKIFYRDALIVAICKLFSSKLVIHLHGKGISEAAKKSRLKAWLYRVTFKNTRVICLSANLVSDISPVYKRKPFVLANGIEINNLEKAAESDQPVVVYLSNLVKSKGIEVFLKSLVQLKKEKLSFKARVIGDAADFSFYQAQTFCDENGLAENVAILGPKFNEQKMQELYNADIFVLPSFNECFPLAILEAMQAGLPVIATNIGGIPDIITNNQQGFLVGVNDQRGLSERIRVLIRNKSLRQEFGVNAKKKFYSNYTITHFYDGLNAIFNEVLNS